MKKEELAQIIREKSRDDYGTLDFRRILPEFNSIQELRSLVDCITSELSDSELIDAWSLSEDSWMSEDINDLCNAMRRAVGSFYDLLKSNFKVITIDESEDNIDNLTLKTYIIRIEDLKKFYTKYIEYDSIINKALVMDPKESELLRGRLSDMEYLEKIVDDEIRNGHDVALVRLVPPSYGDEASIQVFPINVVESLKGNIYLPWGPYELTEFICGEDARNLIEITTEDLEEIIQRFITKYNIKSVL